MAEPAVGLSPDHGELLVVDDEPFLRDAVAASLRFLGFEVTTAETGADALRLARNRPFDLVVMDVMLPDTDGFEVVRRLRGEGSRVPVIFLTARDTQADKVDRADPGRRRLHHQAVRPGGTGGQDPDRAAPDAPRRRRVGAHVRGRRARPGQLRGPPVRSSPRPVADRVPVAAVPDAQPGRVLTREQLLDHVWDYDFHGATTVVATYVAYLRRKLARYGPDLIHTQRGDRLPASACPGPRIRRALRR